MSGFPSCQVCQQNFSLKGQAPFLLPCLHAVCETCVKSAAGGVISCSPCQRDLNLTETRLQKDVVREKQILHLTVQHHQELVLCTHEEDGNQAVCWCQECEEFLCEHCQMVHNSFKITRQHNVHDVEAMEIGNLNEDRYCTFHPKLIADTWDKDCCIFTCGKCRRGDHAGHDVADVEEAAESAREKMYKLGKEIMPTLDNQRVHQAAAEKNLTSLNEKRSMHERKISFTFSFLKDQLDQREKELQIALQNHSQHVSDQLNAKKKTSETCQQRCQAVYDYINNALQYSSMHGILELMQLIEEKFKDCKRLAPSEDYEVLPLPALNTEGLDRIKSTLDQFGAIATEDKVSTKMKDNGTQTEEDVMKDLERSTQEVNQLKMFQEQLSKEKKNMKKEYEEAAEKLRGKIKQLNMSQDQLLKEKAKILEESEEATDKLRQKLTKMEEIQQKIIHQERRVKRCTDVKFSKKKYNAETVHINTEGELINKSQPNPPHSNQRLKKYDGTSSTVPLLQCGPPQYFEVKSRVGIENPLTDDLLLLEIGLAREEEQDQHHCIDGQPKSYSLTVAYYTTHSSICRNVWRHGNKLTCLPDTLENTPGTSDTLHYGVVCDSAGARIAFLDVKNDKLIGKIDNVDSSVTLWPMFGVYNPEWATVSMSLVVGSDIDMTKEKKKLILDCLS